MTYDLATADDIYEEFKANHHDFDHHLVMSWREHHPEEFAQHMFEKKHGCHIFNEDLYCEATSHFINPDGSHGPHWSIGTIKAKSGITNFADKGYTEYDYAYVVNMLYSDYGNVFAEPSYYLKMAKNYLSDGDYYGKAEERAYHDAIERINFFS